MSEATELLNTLDKANASLRLADSTEEPHIIIDNDRFITVPEELERLAVQYDHNIETVTFDCPRYWDGHDMSKMNVYINYLRADNAPGVYKADNVRVNDDDSSIMNFDWTISKNVTTTSGDIVFIVCIKKTDAEGNEQNHWNSELCKDCYVSEGLEIDGGSSEEIRPDIIEQWYYELMSRCDSGEFDGAPGVGIASIEQTTISTQDNGENIVTITLTDGQTTDVSIRNGSTGIAELPTALCKTTDGIHYYCLSTSIDGGWPLVSGDQIIFIHVPVEGGEETNVTSNPTLSFELTSMLSGDFPIKLRTVGGEPDNIPIGVLRNNIPYTMTFTGDSWLIDSYVGTSQEIPEDYVTQTEMKEYVTERFNEDDRFSIFTCVTLDGITYRNDISANGVFPDSSFFTEGRQIILIPVTLTEGKNPPEANTTDTPIVSLMRSDSYTIKLRSAAGQLTTVPIGMLKHGVPYTMTFSGEYWLVDSYVENSQEIPAQIPLITATSSDGETYTYTGEYNEDFNNLSKQIIFVHVGGSGRLTENTSENVKLQFELENGEVLQHDVKLRSATLGTTTVPVGALKYNTPYTMTFNGQAWLIDSYIEPHIDSTQKPYIQPDEPTTAADGSLWIDEDAENVIIYIQDNEPTDVPDGILWIDEDEEITTPDYITQTQMEEYVTTSINDAGHLTAESLDGYVTTDAMESYVTDAIAAAINSIAIAEEEAY